MTHSSKTAYEAYLKTAPSATKAGIEEVWNAAWAAAIEAAKKAAETKQQSHKQMTLDQVQSELAYRVSVT